MARRGNRKAQRKRERATKIKNTEGVGKDWPCAVSLNII